MERSQSLLALSVNVFLEEDDSSYLHRERDGHKDTIFSLWKTFTTNCLRELCQIPLAFHKGW